MKRRRQKNSAEPASGRLLTLTAGIVFVLLAVLILATSDPPLHTGSLLAAAAVGALGVDALIGGARGWRSLLVRIGPLP